jgi:succinoglycan biosynthesis transport protein ExoP
VIQSAPPAGRQQEAGLHGLAALRQRARLIVLASAGGIGLGVLSYVAQPPRFVAEAVIALDVRRIQAMPIDQVVAPLPQENPVVRTELDMIASRDMAQRVIAMLSEAGRSPDGEGPLDLGRLIPRPDALQRARAALGAGIGRLSGRRAPSPIDTGSLIEGALRGNLAVLNDGRSYTIYIAYGADDPVVAARVANAYARAYLDYQDDLQIEATRRVSDWLEARLATLGAKLQRAEQDAERFRATSGLFEIEGVTIAAQRVSALSAELMAARAAYATAEAREKTATLLATRPDGLDGFSDVLGSPIVQQLRVSQSELERRLQVLNDTGAPQSADVPVLTSELETVRQQIRREVDKILVSLRNEIDSAGRRVASLESQLQAAEADYGGSDTARVKLEGLVREANADRAVFESLLGRAKQIGDRKELTDPGVRLISAAAVPVHAAGPRLLSALLLGLMGGATSGVGLALALGRFDHRVRSRQELEAATGLPVLATIPALRGRHRRHPADRVAQAPHSPYAEAFATLQWMLRLAPSLRRAVVLMLTSAQSGDGKTTLALSLARSMAAAGRSVALVTFEPIAGIAPRPKLSEDDDGSHAGASDPRAVLPFGVVPTRDPLSSVQTITPSPTDAWPASLANAQQFGVLMAALRERFEVVIVDAPTLATASRSLQLGTEADAILLVLRWGHTTQAAATASIQRLAYCGLPVRAILLNQVPPREHRRLERSSDLSAPGAPISLGGGRRASAGGASMASIWEPTI